MPHEPPASSKPGPAVLPAGRDASWPGVWNARLLLPGVWRSSHLDDADWGALVADGVEAVVDLRNESGVGGPLRRVHVPLELDLDDDPLFAELSARTGLASPAYYVPFCRRWRDRVQAAVDAIDGATPGVVFHCKSGWDRAGMLSAILLRRAGVQTGAILDDYGRSFANADPDGSGPARLRKLQELGTTWQAELRAFLDSDVSRF